MLREAGEEMDQVWATSGDGERWSAFLKQNAAAVFQVQRDDRHYTMHLKLLGKPPPAEQPRPVTPALGHMLPTDVCEQHLRGPCKVWTFFLVSAHR